MHSYLKNTILLMAAAFYAGSSYAQLDTSIPKKEKDYKNIIRYNLSSALLFGVDKFIVFGYERVLSDKQSFSVNIGRANLPKLVTISTDSFNLKRDRKNTGFNVSADYRFYLAKENKYHAPRGLFIGPYYSYNGFTRNNEWEYTKAGATSSLVSTETDFHINTIGFELGYQLILWKRLSLDFVMVGPGLSRYNLKTRISDNVSEENREQLQEAVIDIISQKFPGMNYVFSDKEFDANGTVRTWSLGYRYLVHIGFLF